MRNYLKICILLLSSVIVLGQTEILHAAEITTVTVLTPGISVVPGKAFNVNVDIEPNNSIAGAQFSLSFNPDLVTVESITEGNLLKQNGANTYFMPGKIDNGLGKISGVYGVIISPGNSVSSSGTLATIKMIAKSSSGISSIAISNVIVGNINGQSVPIDTSNGTVRINQPPLLSAVGNKSIQAESLLSFTVFANDADRDSLTYSASNLPTGASFNALTRDFSWIPGPKQDGEFRGIHFEVTDGYSVDFEDITVTVSKKSPPGSGGGGGGDKGNNSNSVPKSQSTASPSNLVDSDGIFKENIKTLSEDGLVELVIPQNTKVIASSEQVLDQITLVSLLSSQDLGEQISQVGSRYNIEPNGISFNNPVDLTMKYEKSEIPQGVNENNLIIATWDSLSYKLVELESLVDTDSQTIKTQINDFSYYSIIAHTKPAEFKITGLFSTPVEPNSGDSLSLSARISNIGDLRGQYQAALIMDGQLIETKTVSLEGVSDQLITFNPIPITFGVYVFNLEDSHLQVEIKAPTEPGFFDSQNNTSTFKDLDVFPTTSVKPAEMEYSLSLLAKIIAGSMFIFLIITCTILYYRRKGMHNVFNR